MGWSVNPSKYQCELDNDSGEFVVVAVPYHNCPLLYEHTGKIRREVKVWLRDNVGTRALTLELMRDLTQGHAWLALVGHTEPLSDFEEMKLKAMDHMYWRHRSQKLFFYFRTATDAVLFKLAWGGT